MAAVAATLKDLVADAQGAVTALAEEMTQQIKEARELAYQRGHDEGYAEGEADSDLVVEARAAEERSERLAEVVLDCERGTRTWAEVLDAARRTS